MENSLDHEVLENGVDDIEIIASESDETDDDGPVELPDTAFLKILGYISLDDLKQCRLVSRLWNGLCLSPQILSAVSCFVCDGRRDTQEGTNCDALLRESQLVISNWTHLRVRRTHFKQVAWINHELTSTIRVLELNNCSLSWTNILLILSEFDNLHSFSDIQDMYCWDYSTFVEGLQNEEELEANDNFKALRQERLEFLQNLRNVKIHRSQFADCTLYLKMLNLRCTHLEDVSVTTDQSLNPRPSGRFYESLGDLIKKNKSSLQKLWFPYRRIYPAYEFRATDDDQHPFRDFLNHVTENHWGEEVVPESLAELSIQFPVIHVDETLFKQKLLPFLTSWSCLQRLYLNCILLEVGKENLILESIPIKVTPKFGVWVSDNGVNGVIPFLNPLKEYIRSMTIQTWRPNWTQVTEILALRDLRRDEISDYENTFELHYFNKSPNFKNFNMNLLAPSFTHLTHLNLVDHNTRGERLHSSEALATIEDNDMQLLLTYLKELTFLQINANMTFLTDCGLTGLTATACKRMLLTNSFAPQIGDIEGKSFTNLKYLRHAVLRGVGIKLTDVTVYNGFSNLPRLKKLHVYGAQQVTPIGRTFLAQKFPTLKGCDIQI